MTSPFPAAPFVPSAPIRRLDGSSFGKAIPRLAEILRLCVEEGSGVGFLLPFSQAQAEQFWHSRAAGLEDGSRVLLVAETEEGIMGTVSLELASQPNGAHRAEVAKLLVHPEARRQGLAKRLLQEAEKAALCLDRTLLVLDTVTGDRAEKLYPVCGYHTIGVIPDYAALPNGRLQATTVFYKRLRA